MQSTLLRCGEGKYLRLTPSKKTARLELLPSVDAPGQDLGEVLTSNCSLLTADYHNDDLHIAHSVKRAMVRVLHRERTNTLSLKVEFTPFPSEEVRFLSLAIPAVIVGTRNKVAVFFLDVDRSDTSEPPSDVPVDSKTVVVISETPDPLVAYTIKHIPSISLSQSSFVPGRADLSQYCWHSATQRAVPGRATGYAFGKFGIRGVFFRQVPSIQSIQAALLIRSSRPGVGLAVLACGTSAVYCFPVPMQAPIRLEGTRPVWSCGAREITAGDSAPMAAVLPLEWTANVQLLSFDDNLLYVVTDCGLELWARPDIAGPALCFGRYRRETMQWRAWPPAFAVPEENALWLGHGKLALCSYEKLLKTSAARTVQELKGGRVEGAKNRLAAPTELLDGVGVLEVEEPTPRAHGVLRLLRDPEDRTVLAGMLGIDDSSVAVEDSSKADSPPDLCFLEAIKEGRYEMLPRFLEEALSAETEMELGWLLEQCWPWVEGGAVLESLLCILPDFRVLEPYISSVETPQLNAIWRVRQWMEEATFAGLCDLCGALSQLASPQQNAVCDQIVSSAPSSACDYLGQMLKAQGEEATLPWPLVMSLSKRFPLDDLLNLFPPELKARIPIEDFFPLFELQAARVQIHQLRNQALLDSAANVLKNQS